MLQIYNTLTQQKETFIPIEPGKIRMYVCGITTYDYCHLGHGRMLVVFDVIVRFLRSAAYEVTYVRNITDIDDKIINRANEEGIPFDELTAKFIDIMHEDERALNILPPDIEPRATGHMAEIIHMIEILVEKGFAYPAANGDVYYSVKQFPDYTKLSHRNLDEMMSGARVDVEDAKNDPRDFALWKSAKAGEPGWDSPWGFGRPGWHIECSAMSTCCLGDTFDIHGGGSDLIFPHHENEIAQSEAATGEKFANIWMHNGFVRIDDEKMSKSLGNFFTIRDVTEKYDPEVLRYFILTSHYRSPLNYSDKALDNAKAAITTLYTALRGVEIASADSNDSEYHQRVRTAMNDDFNTAEVLPVLFDLAKEVNRYKEKDTAKAIQHASILRELANLIGLLHQEPETFLRGGENQEGASADDIDELILQRNKARDEKNWSESDRIRDVLKAQGIVLEDTGGMTTWRRE